MHAPQLATTASTAPFADDFIKHGVYLRNWSARTVRTYRQGLGALASVLDGALPSKPTLQSFVIAMRERGLSPGGINMYARTINSYLSWLNAEGHVNERLRIKLLPNPPKPYTTFSDADLRRIVTHVPKGRARLRAWTLAVVLLDTGVRIAEALSLEREQVDLDGMVLRIFGKGQKVRLVPISTEGRKALFRWLSRTDGRYVFGTKRGRQWSHRNAYRDVTGICRSLGVVSARVNPHAFRHCFAVSYVRNGGDIYRLSRILGHTSISTTQVYLRSMGLEHLPGRAREVFAARAARVEVHDGVRTGLPRSQSDASGDAARGYFFRGGAGGGAGFVWFVGRTAIPRPALVGVIPLTRDDEGGGVGSLRSPIWSLEVADRRTNDFDNLHQFYHLNILGADQDPINAIERDALFIVAKPLGFSHHEMTVSRRIRPFLGPPIQASFTCQVKDHVSPRL
jgi:site-specific recombinase XerD